MEEMWHSNPSELSNLKFLTVVLRHVDFLPCSVLSHCFELRYLTEKVVPGNRVTIIGIYSIKKIFQKSTRVSSINIGILVPSCEA